MTLEDAEKLANIILDEVNFSNEIEFDPLLKGLEKQFPEIAWRSLLVEDETENWVIPKV